MPINLVFLKHIIGVVLAGILAMAGSVFYKRAKWIKQDNPVEESIEVWIEKQTGIDVDLSPDTPEKPGIDMNTVDFVQTYNKDIDGKTK